MGSEAYSGARIPVLTNDNFLLWRTRIKSVLEAKEIWDTIFEDHPPSKPQTGDANFATRMEVWKRWRRSNAEALSLMTCSMSDQKLSCYINETSAKALYEKLSKSLDSQARMQRMKFSQELTSLAMHPTETLSEYLDRALGISSKCASVGKEIQTEELIFYTLEGLPRQYLDVVRLLQRDPDLTFDDLRIQLLLEAQRMTNQKGRPLEDNAYKISASRRKPETEKQKPTNFVCYKCGKQGHYARNCRSRGRTPNKSNYKDRTHRSIGGNTRKPPDGGFVTCENLAEACNNSFEESWIIDSGATSHITCNEKILENLKPLNEYIHTAKEGVNAKVIGQGNTRLLLSDRKGHDSKIIDVHRVLHVPQARNNLMSVYEIVQQNNTVVFDKSFGARIFGPTSELLAEAPIQNKMFVLSSLPVLQKERSDNVEVTTAAQHVECKMLWHRRLGHTNERYLNQMKKQSLVRGIEFGPHELEKCDSCLRAKGTSLPHPSITTRWSTRPFQLLHMDLCGPMPVSSLSNSRYILTMVDDFTRRSFVLFLSAKSDTCEKVRDFIAIQERNTGQHLQSIRSDNGGEFANEEFQAFTRKAGIKHQFTVPYSPESNGVAERMNRTLLDMARTMLLESRLPLKFWAEAVATASHVRNVLPTKGQTTTPMEKWSGRKPSVKYLRVFGCLTYSTVAKQLRGKWDPRAKRGVMLGYARNRKGYRVYDANKNRVEEVRDVIFNEHQMAWTFLQNPETMPEEIDRLRYHSNQEIEIPLNADLNKKEGTQNSEETSSTDSDESSDSLSDENATPTVKKRGRPPGTSAAEIRRRKREQQLEWQRDRQSRNLRTSERRANKQQNDEQINLLIELDERTPKSYREALESPDAQQWQEAMDEEIASLHLHQVWELEKPKGGEKILRSKWVYKIKSNHDGSVRKYKARLVVGGYDQKQGRDYEESFAPVVRLETIRLLLSIAAREHLVTRQCDVKSAYLHGELNRDVKMEQPVGYTCPGKEDLVCNLKRSLYGLPDAGRCWHETLHEALTKIGCEQSFLDPCVYYYRQGEEYVFLCVYVDDFAFLGTSNELISLLIKRIGTYFHLSEMGELQYFLGMEITRTENGFLLGQRKYARKVLERFNMDDCKGVSTPLEQGQNHDTKHTSPQEARLFQEMIGSTMYLVVGTRPDLCFPVTQLSRYMIKPQKNHLAAAKRILRYLQSTKDYVLEFTDEEDSVLTGYADASWNSAEDSKSFSGVLVQLGNNTILWNTRKQGVIALSTCEAEILAIHEVVKVLVWLRQFLSEIRNTIFGRTPIQVFTDSTAAISFFKNINHKPRTRHINRKYRFAKEEIDKKNIELIFLRTEDQPSDLLTKGLSAAKTQRHLRKIKMRSLSCLDSTQKGGMLVNNESNPASQAGGQNDAPEQGRARRSGK